MKHIVIIALSLLVTVSCSSRKEKKKEIEKQVAASNVTTSQALGTTIEEAISHSPNLTEEQKKKIRTFVEVNKKTGTELYERSYKLRGVLVQELFSQKVSDSKVKQLKREIRHIEHAKLQNTFSTVEKILSVVKGQPDQKNFQDTTIYFQDSKY